MMKYFIILLIMCTLSISLKSQDIAYVNYNVVKSNYLKYQKANFDFKVDLENAYAKFQEDLIILNTDTLISFEEIKDLKNSFAKKIQSIREHNLKNLRLINDEINKVIEKIKQEKSYREIMKIGGDRKSDKDWIDITFDLIEVLNNN